MSQLALMPAIVVLTAGAVAAVTDIWRFKVYNLLTFPLVLSGLLYHSATGGLDGCQASLGGVLFGFALLLLPYAMGAMGAGDVKFVAGVGAWLGMEPLLGIVIIGAATAAIYGIGLMVYYGRYREFWSGLKLLFVRLLMLGRHLTAEDDVESVQNIARQSTRRHRLIPFSAMITIGVFVIIVTSVWQQ